MTDPVFEPDNTAAADLAQARMRAILAWLDTPPALQPAAELLSLRANLLALRETQVTARQRTTALDQIYARAIAIIAILLPELTDKILPIPREIRNIVHSLQDLLQMLAEDLLRTLDGFAEDLTEGLHRPKELTLSRALRALARHLLISDLVASAAGTGIWLQLHQVYATAQRMNLAKCTPEGEQSSPQHIYFAALLMGCAQPASFTSREIDFVANYLNLAGCAEALPEAVSVSAGTFWVAPSRDTPAIACSRKAAAPDTDVFYFSCTRLAELLGKQLAALDAGCTAQQIGLPTLAGATAGHGVLRRLSNYWGHPGKRRFQRRRQNYRSVLCSGINRLWQLFHDDHSVTPESSNWMITNESPDGYAIMHVSGKIGKPTVGDVAAIRTESSKDWQICLVRWALSENREHLELGLQILAPRAIPATLALSAKTGSGDSRQLPALILPETPPLRSTQTLLLPSGMLDDPHKKLVLIIEQENIEVREVRAIRLEEQTGSIEAFSIQADGLPD